ncbi:MAG: hypothetical protein KC457_08835, partial [Myxococcales bacterium]|nr:hypothetical protein [Myxococcales bacterium]
MLAVLHSLVLAFALGGPGEARAGESEAPAQPEEQPAEPQGLERWLTRPLPASARFLDHGVIALTAAGGTPHRYRLDLRVGLLDVLSIGLTTHWLPGQRAPQVWPV